MLCDRDRVRVSMGCAGIPYPFVDAVTGTALPRAAADSPAADTSGALVWIGGGHVMSSGGLYNIAGCALTHLGMVESISCFCYGVSVVRVCRQGSDDDDDVGDVPHAYQVLRFDDAPRPQPGRKVGRWRVQRRDSG